MKGDRLFLDTNVIIYAFDVTAGNKHTIARDIMVDLWQSGLGVISTQVLQEFFVSVTRKIPKPMGVSAARDIVTDLLKWNLVINDGESILGAVDILTRHGFSFWDSLIIDAAVRGGASELLSEDLSHGQTIAGVMITNPFVPAAAQQSENRET
jgi:predicted nucleic acid-binding protein